MLGDHKAAISNVGTAARKVRFDVEYTKHNIALVADKPVVREKVSAEARFIQLVEIRVRLSFADDLVEHGVTLPHIVVVPKALHRCRGSVCKRKNVYIEYMRL